MQCSRPSCFAEERFRTAAGDPICRICHGELPDAVRATCRPVDERPKDAGFGPPTSSSDGYDVYESKVYGTKPIEYIESDAKMLEQMEARMRARTMTGRGTFAGPIGRTQAELKEAVEKGADVVYVDRTLHCAIIGNVNMTIKPYQTEAIRALNDLKLKMATETYKPRNLPIYTAAFM